MKRMVLFGVGSPLVADIEESMDRSGVELEAGIINRPGESYLIDQSRLVELAAVQSDQRILPSLVPLFTPANRWQAVQEAARHGFCIPGSLIDASVPEVRSLDHQPGLFVNAGCTLGAARVYEGFVLINRGATIGHHVHLGPYISIGPAAVLCGLVRVAHGAVIGAGSVILPDVRVGANSVVAAGSVVNSDVPDHCLVMGNPARIVKQNIPGYRDGTVPPP